MVCCSLVAGINSFITMRYAFTAFVLLLILSGFKTADIPVLSFNTEAHFFSIGELEFAPGLNTGGFQWTYGEPDRRLSLESGGERWYYDRYGLSFLVKGGEFKAVTVTYQPGEAEERCKNTFKGSLFFGPLTVTADTQHDELAKAGEGFSCTDATECAYKKQDEKLQVSSQFNEQKQLAQITFFLAEED